MKLLLTNQLLYQVKLLGSFICPWYCCVFFSFVVDMKVLLLCRRIVDAHFCESISKSPCGRKPNKNQGPKAHQEDRRTRKVQRKNTDLPQIYSKTQICSKLQICSRIQICCKIQFFGRMASADKDKLGLRSFWSSQHYLVYKGPNPFV